MHNVGVLTKLLAAAGVLLAWLPLLLPLVLGLARLAGGRTFLVDWLMPAELFPVALLGGVLLLWAARRARSRPRPIAWGLALAIFFLIASQGAAVATGLAGGSVGPEGWPWALVVGFLAAYVLALVAVAVAGLLLVRDVFRRER